MALPDYSNQYGTGSMLASVQNANQKNKQKNKKNKTPVNSSPVQTTTPTPDTGTKGPGGTLDKGGNPYPVPPTPGPGPTDPNQFTVPQPPLNPGPYTFGNGGLDNPFYDPSATYIPQGYRGNTPGLGQDAGSPDPASRGNVWAEDNPEAYYYGLMNQKGLGGMDARSRAGQSMYADYYRGYQAAHLNNSELMWAQYANQQNPNNLVQLLSNDQLGINTNQNTGPISWTLRG